MPTPTTRLRANLQDPGSNLNVWGTKLNTEALALLDEAIAGVEKITLSASTYTLTSANYATDQARNAALIFQGSPAAPVAVTIPAVEKVYAVVNQTAQTVTLGCGGTVATLAAGDYAVVWCDGADCGLGSVTAGAINGLILAASLTPGQLPGQAGQAGKWLNTNGTYASWQSIVIPDIAGGADATITTSAALTAASAVVQSADMATAAQSVTLPDATTLTEGGRKFVIVNSGNRAFGVRSNGGLLLAAVPAGAAAELHLRDNATAAGSWAVTGRGLEPALTLVDYTWPSTYTVAVEAACRLTDSLSLHFAQNAAAALYVVAADNSGGTVGTPTLVDAAATNAPVGCFRISDTQALLFWSTTGASFRAIVLTVSGTAVSTGTLAQTGTSFIGQASFTGRPLLAQLTPTLYVALYGNGGFCCAISVSGTAVTIGANTASGAVTTQQALAVYPVSSTTALALYIDDSGSAGAPYSIRGCVLSVSGTTVTVGTSNGINDIVLASAALPTCQMSATKYAALIRDNGTNGLRWAYFSVSGTVVTANSGLITDAGFAFNGGDPTYTSHNANRFQPNLYAIDSTRVLLTYGDSTIAAMRHVILTESGGALTAGAILYSLWNGISGSGGNFPQTPGGFLAFSTHADEHAIMSVTVNGTSLDVTGTWADGGVMLPSYVSARFGLSGGVVGISQAGVTSNFARVMLVHLFRFRPNAPPQYLGPWRRNNIVAGEVGVEVAANKVAMTASTALTQPSASGTSVRLLVAEFAQ